MSGIRQERPSLGVKEYLARLGEPIRVFLRLEAAAGILLMVALVLAMLIENSPLSSLYQSFLEVTGEVRVGALSVEKPLVLWVNDLWMAIFFFLVGLEIKHEVLCGHLSDKSQMLLPAAGAIGGMAVPAAIYLALNWGDPIATRGWAIPTATDIAFALGVLSLLGSRIPVSLKVFLMTLAILDDLGAIVVIALFYTADLSTASLLLAAIAVGVLVTLNRLGITNVAAYVLVGAVLWVCVLKSGVHATLAGVVTALAVPLGRTGASHESALQQLIHALHPWVAYGILPMFAFVNSGIAFAELSIASLLSPVPLGIAAGLFLGKQVGVFGFVWLALKLRLARMPVGATYSQLYGIALLCGVGFTMSLFIGGLAFEQGGSGYARADRFAIILSSLLAGVCGYLVLRAGSKVVPDAAAAGGAAPHDRTSH